MTDNRSGCTRPHRYTIAGNLGRDYYSGHDFDDAVRIHTDMPEDIEAVADVRHTDEITELDMLRNPTDPDYCIRESQAVEIAAMEPKFTLRYRSGITGRAVLVERTLTRDGVERVGAVVMRVADRHGSITDIEVIDEFGSDVTFDFACFGADTLTDHDPACLVLADIEA